MITFDKSKKILYIKAKESFLQKIPDMNKLRGIDTKQLQEKLNDFERELVFLKNKVEITDTIPDFEWRETVAKIDQMEREIERATNIAMATKEQGKTK